MFSKILIANRGEIACRIIRSCHRLGVRTVAVYSDADRSAKHVEAADEALRIGPSESSASYLDQEKIIAAAKQAGAEAIHPGYGFLAENSLFTEHVEAADLTFIGPPANVSAILGDKVEAKAVAKSAKVPLVPGITCTEKNQKKLLSQIEKFAQENGYPVLLKAAAGGGGRGMRQVHAANELPDQLERARKEAKASFGSDQLFVEKLVTAGRHVEVQIIADSHGDVRHLFDRDCSFQRNHQKVIEEAPAPALKPETRSALRDAAVALCKAVGYVSAGTVEFLVDSDGAFYFLEVNSRLQVEHPVTEAVSGLDLVALQLKIAAGERLSDLIPSALPEPCGHAIECRICAEQPQLGFRASTGQISIWDVPLDAPGKSSIRFDGGFGVGDIVSHYYDSLLGKLIVHAPNRTAAIAELQSALARIRITGVHTNISFLQRLLGDHQFSEVSHTIFSAPSLLPQGSQRFTQLVDVTCLAFGADFATYQSSSMDAWQARSGFRLSGHPPVQRQQVRVEDEILQVEVIQVAATTLAVSVSDGNTTQQRTLEVSPVSAGRFRTVLNDHQCDCRFHQSGDSIWIAFEQGTFCIERVREQLKQHTDGDRSLAEEIVSPLPGTVVSIAVSPGDSVATDQTLIVLESMKMEVLVKAPATAIVQEILVAAGETVQARSVVVKLSYQ